MDTTTTNGAAKGGYLTEWLLRVFAVGVMVIFAARIFLAWRNEPERLTLLALLVSECITVGILLFARRAVLRDMTPWAVAATVYAILFFLLFDFQGTRRLIPEWLGVTLQVAGTLWQASAKLVLGRCFGLLPAVRGIVSRGHYRIVRHPIYLGYLVAHIGFLGANFSWRNVAVLTLLYAAQVHRMGREEQALSTLPEYVDYRERVRWRLIPGVY